jgi:hypothetical protein
MSRRRPPRPTAPAPALALHEAGARAEALLRERERLLREVRKKKAQLERVQQQMASDAAAAGAKMAPLIRRHDALVAELTVLFDELLAPGRASTRARRSLLRLRRLLELQGVLPPLTEATEPEPEVAHEPPPRARAQSRAPRERAPAPSASAPEVSGAEQVGQQRRSLRELFRSLVKAIHPDQARQEPERERRTQVMKQVTRAYEEGDLARLLELESSWQSEQAVSEQVDALTRCQALERINRELLDQVRRLTREVRDLKREAYDASLGLAPDELCERAARELDELEDICRFVESFRDGKLSISELERGPESLRDLGEIESLDQVLSAFFEEAAPPPRARRRRRSA